MQILQLRLKNLNSLIGEWEIDFTDPAFVSDGIFSITGPTGAGKTTILDAICLALYGRTPRLNKISKGENEVMSRQTGECFAEVTFSTLNGHFRCHWSQHRARKKSDGELQNPRHELAEINSGKILETRLVEISRQIEKITGMDFARFTRSMLLAQGEFAAFLQAAPDERAPILEQITGTEIYSHISIRVHETMATARRELDRLTANFNGIQPRAEGEEQQIHLELTQKIQQNAGLNKEITDTQRTLVWLENINRLETELKQIAQQQQTWLIRKAAFTPESNRLDSANRALELLGEYSKLVSVRNEQETDRNNLAICTKSLPNLEQAVKHAEQSLKSLNEQLDLQRINQQNSIPVIRRVRELDVQIREKESPINTANKEITAQKETLTTQRNHYQQNEIQLGQLKKILTEHITQLEITQADGLLVESLAGIQAQFSTLKQLNEQQIAKLAEIKTTEKAITEINRLSHDQTEKRDTLKKELTRHQHLLLQKQTESGQLLGNRSLADRRREITPLTERKSQISRAIETMQTLATARSAAIELEKHANQLGVTKIQFAEQLKIQERELAALEREVKLLETQSLLLKQIKNLEDVRKQLKDDEPCPLCGALHHPFATENIPQPDETISALHQAKATLKTQTDAVATLKIKQAETNKDIEQITIRQQEQRNRIQADETLIQQYGVVLLPGITLSDLLLQLPHLLQETIDKLTQENSTLEAAEILEIEIDTLRASLDKTQETTALAESELRDILHQQKSDTRLLEHLKQESEISTRKQQAHQQKLQQEIAVYQPGILSPDQLDEIEIHLVARRDQWQQHQIEKSAQEQQINVLTVQVQQQSTQIQRYEEEIKLRQQQLDQLQHEFGNLHTTRFQLFADKQPDQEEQLLTTAVEVAQKSAEYARQQLEAETQEAARLKNRTEDLIKTIATRTTQLDKLQETFATQLVQSGFTDEASFTAACLPEEERKHLAQRTQQLADERTVLDAQQKDKTTALQTEQLKRMTDQPREVHEQALTQSISHQQILQQEIGGLQQKLEDIKSNEQKQQAQLQAIEAQQRECARWDLLHRLIGSADGKKYRNFAQGLTFEVMIRHANRQLQKLSDRYLLIRDPARPLELNIIDNYQAGEIRSTKNLSGGESFIISLALALGLSHMVSHNIRVDSLFLDEGFGTLDEEALDTALETLTNLQQEGKLIGIISHVAALQERISTRIQVLPQSGGKSVLAGPGCRQRK